ncbi:MAG TPA: NUDIX hydrolase [Herpetosiphonaceae bacterium]|nr:NUDIX hydrolase [Herpetosiphonaceae bacterium]
MRRTIRYQAAVIRDHHILLLQQTDHGCGRTYWLLPGGRREAGETEEHCVEREVLEETGLHVTVQTLLLDEPNILGRSYRRRKTYSCAYRGGEARPGYEPEAAYRTAYSFTAIGWFDLRQPTAWNEQVVADPITYPLLRRIQGLLGYGGHMAAGDGS